MRLAVVVLGALAACRAPAGGAAGVEPISNTAAPGAHPAPVVDLDQLDDSARMLYEQMIDQLASPCGRAQSLRRTIAEDPACKRGPYAARYVAALLQDDTDPARIETEYRNKYDARPKVSVDVRRAPHVGDVKAPVRIVEFFDYGCPHCAHTKPILDQLVADHPRDVVEYFLMFPLGNPSWPHSKSAAQAALAANAQGKFAEMHALLFETAPAHAEADVVGYAAKLGLDAARFLADYRAAAAQVDSDRAQGDAVGVESTPTLIFNDRKYQGPLQARYLALWIEEEIAVNR